MSLQPRLGPRLQKPLRMATPHSPCLPNIRFWMGPGRSLTKAGSRQRGVLVNSDFFPGKQGEFTKTPSFVNHRFL